MDFENNGQSATNFMHKIKKQAKRLFQISKTTNNNLEINSLSKAQELLAQINGYPDWHALEKHISNSKTILQKENENKITLSKFDFDNIFYRYSPYIPVLQVGDIRTGALAPKTCISPIFLL